MTLADLVIILVVGLAAATGWRRGLTGFAFALAGLVAGSVVGALLVQRIVGEQGPAIPRLLLQVGLVLVPAVALAALGRRWGTRIGRRLDVARLRGPDRVAGATVRGALALVLLSLTAPPVAALAPVAAQRPVADSVILHATEALLPTPQRLVDAIARTLRVPSDLAALVPSEGGSGPSASEVARVRDAVRASLVSIHGSGVDGTGREGSGFVVRPGVVATNAHVVVDTTDLSVTDGGGRHPATVAVIDSASDVALLRVQGSSAPAVTLAPDPVTNGTPAVVMGFPGDGPLTTGGAVVVQRLPLLGSEQASSLRLAKEAYRLRAVVRPGNSGGPLLDLDGHVIGIVSARSLVDPDEGYALTLAPLRDALAR